MFALMTIAVAFGGGPEMRPVGQDIARVQDPRYAIKVGMTLDAVTRLMNNEGYLYEHEAKFGHHIQSAWFFKSGVTVHLDRNDRVTRIEKHGR